ncbi:MAG: hypothetical protein HF978_12850 [Desulfobacteraceae bacterium]|nr:hypothetical protein [Desulfobacteraceae bacterium]MBC2756428.1 hypothetical protein [Desulfobacteraceae bacterium]MBC2763558.1 hypothetical protein [ANME-2 cluster archaeon]
MKKTISISLIMLLTFILIGTTPAETPLGVDDEAPKYSNGHCQGMRHKGSGMSNGPEHFTGHLKGIGGITLKKLMHMDLSDGQKKDVANILAAYRDDSRKMADQLMEAKKAFFETISSKKAYDESAVRQSFKQMSAIMENLVVLKTKIMSELKPVLSKDQLKNLMAHHPKKSDKMDKMKQMKKQRNVNRAMMDTWINTYADTPNSGQ